MSGWVESKFCQQSVQPVVMAVLQALEVAPHIFTVPRLVASERRDAVPIGVMRIDEDHGIVRGAATKGSGARIQDAINALVGIDPILGILLLSLGVAVV